MDVDLWVQKSGWSPDVSGDISKDHLREEGPQIYGGVRRWDDDDDYREEKKKLLQKIVYFVFFFCEALLKLLLSPQASLNRLSSVWKCSELNTKACMIL